MANHTRYSETELKLYVPDLQAVAHRLGILDAELARERVFERNIRYENAQHSLTSQGIVVRLRADDRVRLTYKEPISEQIDDIHSRFEAEVEVSDYDAMNLILEKLGYKPFIVYEKYRTTYNLQDTEIVLDQMPYGNFVEIEGEPVKIRSVRKQLNLEGMSAFHVNYLALFEQVKRQLNLTMHDLTFANFADVKVPSAVFTSMENEM